MTPSPDYQPRDAWLIAALLTGLALINFLDKIVLGMLAVPLMAEFNLSASEFGVIAGSFFWLFSTSSVLVGFLSTRVPTRWLLLAMALSWSLLQLPLAFAAVTFTILICRVVLGAAEGPASALSMHELFKWFPDEKRNLPVAILNQGGALGLVLSGLLIPPVTQHLGWRMNFMLLGVIGALWSVLWLLFGKESRPEAHTVQRDGLQTALKIGADQSARLPYRTILGSPAVLLVFLLGFATYWTTGLVLTWLPAYLQKGLGFDAVTAGRMFSMTVMFTTPYTIALSWFSQRLQSHGASTRLARVQVINATFLAGGALLITLTLVDLQPTAKVLLFALANALPSICFALAPAILAELVPAGQRGAIMSIYTALASSAGAIAPAVMGRLVQASGNSSAHGYETGFVIGGALLIAAALASARYLHPERARLAMARPPLSGPLEHLQ
ncbi:MFS transporter [Paraburkholderia sp. GAS334]|uniref:MFS transporter n=1 Tax=Paraburkholderia sp. GAS334 TaxID=3035131 RepID=UPI003D1DBA0A